MSTLLATVNPDAAKLVGNVDLPSVGVWVLYHFRPMEIVAGMRFAPALVLKADVDNAELVLMVVRAPDDIFQQERVPRRRGQERGWEYIESGDLAARAMRRADEAMARADAVWQRLEDFMGELSDVFFGEQGKPEIALLDQFAAIKARVEALEGRPPARKPRNPSES